jgi:hypothetical protein
MRNLRIITLGLGSLLCLGAAGCGFIPRLPGGTIIDHLCTRLSDVPVRYITEAKNTLHIAYGHTSHGSQLITGMNGLESVMGEVGKAHVFLNMPKGG